MNAHEERMCELQADIFESSRDRFPCGSTFFVTRYMRSPIAKKLDRTEDEYNYISLEEAMSLLEDAYPSLKKESDKKLPGQVLRWMGYIYRCYGIRKRISSLRLYKVLKAEKLLSLYEAFHTLDPDECVDRIEEAIKENAPLKQSDYEVFRATRLKFNQ